MENTQNEIGQTTPTLYTKPFSWEGKIDYFPGSLLRKNLNVKNG